jgi:hypothetical protein
MQTIVIDRDTDTITTADGAPVDPATVFGVFVTTSEGEGPSLDVICGVEGDGGAPVLSQELAGEASELLESAGMLLRLRGFALVRTEVCGHVNQPDAWTETSFGYVATALRR